LSVNRRHRADHLAAGRLRVQDAANREGVAHAPHAHFAGGRIDADLGKVRAERGLRAGLGQIAGHTAGFLFVVTCRQFSCAAFLSGWERRRPNS